MKKTTTLTGFPRQTTNTLTLVKLQVWTSEFLEDGQASETNVNFECKLFA